jgi:hypothetical protein
MSQLRVPGDVPALEQKHEVMVSSSDGKPSNDPAVQDIVPVAAVDNESEPVVTRIELWSYCCVSLHDSLRSCEGVKRLSSIL